MKKIVTMILIAVMTVCMSVPVWAISEQNPDSIEDDQTPQRLKENPSRGKGAGTYAIEVDGLVRAEDDIELVISVDVAWDQLEFQYTGASKGRWLPGTHTYSQGEEAKWTEDKASITITNHSNLDIDAAFRFDPNTGVTTTGTFYSLQESNSEEQVYQPLTSSNQKLRLSTAENTQKENAPQKTMYFGVSGDAISEDTTLGTITISISKGGVSTAAELRAAVAELATQPTGGTVTLARDIDLGTDPLIIDYVLSEMQLTVFTIDLAGHTLSGTNTTDGDDYYLIRITDKAEASIENGTVSYICTNTDESTSATAIVGRGAWHLYDCTVNAIGAYALDCTSTGNVGRVTFTGGLSKNGKMITVRSKQTLYFFGASSIEHYVSCSGSTWGLEIMESGTYSFNGTSVPVTNYLEYNSYSESLPDWILTE